MLDLLLHYLIVCLLLMELLLGVLQRRRQRGQCNLAAVTDAVEESDARFLEFRLLLPEKLDGVGLDLLGVVGVDGLVATGCH